VNDPRTSEPSSRVVFALLPDPTSQGTSGPGATPKSLVQGTLPPFQTSRLRAPRGVSEGGSLYHHQAGKRCTGGTGEQASSTL
jgi:hypothetical protein